MLTRQSCQETGVLPCPPVTRAPFRIVDAYLAFLLLWESSLADSPHLTRRIDIFLQMSLAPVGGWHRRGVPGLDTAFVCDCLASACFVDAWLLGCGLLSAPHLLWRVLGSLHGETVSSHFTPCNYEHPLSGTRTEASRAAAWPGCQIDDDGVRLLLGPEGFCFFCPYSWLGQIGEQSGVQGLAIAGDPRGDSVRGTVHPRHSCGFLAGFS